ncbi:MAG: hypothetical protein J0M08_05530 [Bacteroidetes bacterium]|nr:hypothetical protein [Bacteroidota bacterium]
MKIESDKVLVENTNDKLFTYLSDFNNFSQLMPAQVTNWKSTADECSFTINGLATVGMKIINKVPNEVINIVSGDKTPFKFTLNIHLKPQDGGAKTEGQLLFESDLNPMMKMMVEKPLTNFFNMLAQKMKDIK